MMRLRLAGLSVVTASRALLRGMCAYGCRRIIRSTQEGAMPKDRETELQEASEAVRAQLRVQEFALLELLTPCHGTTR